MNCLNSTVLRRLCRVRRQCVGSFWSRAASVLILCFLSSSALPQSSAARALLFRLNFLRLRGVVSGVCGAAAGGVGAMSSAAYGLSALPPAGSGRTAAGSVGNNIPRSQSSSKTAPEAIHAFQSWWATSWVNSGTAVKIVSRCEASRTPRTFLAKASNGFRSSCDKVPERCGINCCSLFATSRTSC